jgi:hypothetical protein
MADERSDQAQAEGRLGPGDVRYVRGIPTASTTIPRHGFWTTAARDLVAILSWRVAYSIVAELFRALNDLYINKCDILYALTMSSSRVLNAYHETSRTETTLSFETFVRKSDGPSHPLTYTAVSYAWGDPTPRHTILVDGHPRMIAQNLWEFLMRTRSYNETRWLWIDALSISQSDLEERRHQVGIMSRIFSGADKVLVWLGERERPRRHEHDHPALLTKEDHARPDSR